MKALRVLPVLTLLTILSLPYAALAVGSFHSYECTQDCSGHEAGYAWAERKGITNEYDCGGISQSFIEGCLAYAEDNYEDDQGAAE